FPRNRRAACPLGPRARTIPRRLGQPPFSSWTAPAMAGALDLSLRGLQVRPAFAIARMCSGVVPQQPPTIFNQPFVTQAVSLGANDAGVSGNPVGESGSGNPAFGYAPT